MEKLPPGVAFLNVSREGRVRPIARRPLLDGVRENAARILQTEVVPRNFSPSVILTEGVDYFWRF